MLLQPTSSLKLPEVTNSASWSSSSRSRSTSSPSSLLPDVSSPELLSSRLEDYPTTTKLTSFVPVVSSTECLSTAELISRTISSTVSPTQVISIRPTEVTTIRTELVTELPTSTLKLVDIESTVTLLPTSTLKFVKIELSEVTAHVNTDVGWHRAVWVGDRSDDVPNFFFNKVRVYIL